MTGNRLSLLLLSTNRCNAACDYCFEDETGERLSLEHLRCIVDKLTDHMDRDRIGAERFWEYFVDELGVFDFQINTPYPGGETNEVEQSMSLDVAELAQFHCELADIWLERGHRDDVRVGPFDELLNARCSTIDRSSEVRAG